ncbi:MAG: helix-turn-helix domain-containing protein, partial [Paracoccaceae bacterium]|nr:helix-turn-helix domain-containing protein [Paracoccaceae bacterium]
MARTIAKDHDEKRALIRKAAAKVFAEQGFDRASMSLLAKEAGISKANIYHYYGSKDALLFDLLDTKLAALLRRILMV